MIKVRRRREPEQLPSCIICIRLCVTINALFLFSFFFTFTRLRFQHSWDWKTLRSHSSDGPGCHCAAWGGITTKKGSMTLVLVLNHRLCAGETDVYNMLLSLLIQPPGPPGKRGELVSIIHIKAVVESIWPFVFFPQNVHLYFQRAPFH